MLSKNYVGLSKVYAIVLKFPFDQTISLRIINEKMVTWPMKYIIAYAKNNVYMLKTIIHLWFSNICFIFIYEQYFSRVYKC